MRLLRILGYAGLALLVLLAATLVYFATSTRAEIDALEARLIAKATPPADAAAEKIATLPAPVQRFFAFTFPGGAPQGISHAVIEMKGLFRRPLTEDFNDTTARQVAAIVTPDMVFSADTPIMSVLWAIAWDRYLDGEMEMNARVLSAMTVMHEEGNPTLNGISLRRWLLESSTYPMALLPGGPVAWEPIDDTHAKAVVAAHGIRAEMIATFDEDGALVALDATTPGDLTTPYHGSGERAERRAFQLVDGVRVPMEFEIFRVGADGVKQPFWKARITHLAFVR